MSLREMLLSTEMNTKPAFSVNKNNLSFRKSRSTYKRYPARTIVSGISFAVSQGETLVLLGRSGVGKTTLLRLRMEWLVPTQGEVLVVSARHAIEVLPLRRGIGYVSRTQGSFLILRLPRRRARSRFFFGALGGHPQNRRPRRGNAPPRWPSTSRGGGGGRYRPPRELSEARSTCRVARDLVPIIPSAYG